MVEGRLFPEERLIRSAVSLPVLSDGLRTRMLAAALEAHRRRSQARQIVCSGVVLVAVLGWTAWSGSLSTFGLQMATSDVAGRTDAVDGGDDLESAFDAPHVSGAAMLVSTAGDDWRLVEAQLQTREEFTRRIQMAF